jgi:hypothetical protein
LALAYSLTNNDADTVTMCGQVIRKRDCFAKIVTLDSGKATHWRNLAAAMSDGDVVTVGTECDLTKDECRRRGAQ